MDINLKLIGITDSRYCGDELIESCKKAIIGGIKTIQFRDKEVTDKEYYRKAVSLVALAKKMDVSVIINDRCDVAIATNADGVHIGKDDLPVKAVKKIYRGYIGKTVKNLDESIKAMEEGVDYIGVGPFFPSKTKPQNNLITANQINRIKEKVSIPIIAIGGINANNAKDILLKGAYGIAVSEALFKGDVIENAKKLTKITDKYGGN